MMAGEFHTHKEGFGLGGSGCHDEAESEKASKSAR